MNKDFDFNVLEALPIAYAYHKIICIDNKPIDYEFIHVNKEFERLTELKKGNIIGKKVSDVLPSIRSESFDWIKTFGDIALNDGQKQFEQFSISLKRWYRVKAYSPKHGYFVTVFSDITKEREQIDHLHSLVEISHELFQLSATEIDYQKIMDNVLALSEAKFAAFNLYDEDGKQFATKAIAGNRLIINRIIDFMGIKLEGKYWDHDEARALKIKDKAITRFSSLSDLTGDVIPRPIISLLTKSFGVGETVLIKIMKNDIMIGDFTLFMPKGKAFEKDIILQIYAGQLGWMIDRQRTQAKLALAYKRHDSLISNIPGIAYRSLIGENRIILFISNEVEQITGYASEVFVRNKQRAFDSIIHSDDRAFVMKSINAAIKNREKWGIEYRISHKNGDVVWVHEEGRAVKGEDGKTILLDGFIFNITEKKTIELALRESEERFQQISENISEVFWLRSADNSKMVYVNPAYEKVWGRTCQSIYNNPDSFIDSVYEQDKPAVLAEFQKYMNHGKFDLEYRIVRPDGEMRWVRAQSFPVKNSENVIIGHTGIAVDVTERKIKEDIIKENEKRFETLFNDSPVSILIHDKDTGEIIDANELAWKTYGLNSLRELQNNEFWMEPPYSRNEALKWIQKAATEGIQSFEWKNCRINGEIFWEQVVLRPISIGGIERVLSTTIDITDRKKAEEQLAAEQQQLNTYFTSSLDLLCIANTKGEFIRLNPEWEKVLGYPVSELEGKNFLDYVHPDDVPATLDAISELDNQKEVTSFINRYRCKDGSYRHIEWRAKPIGETIYSVARDISKQKATEDVLKASRNLLDNVFQSIKDGIIVLDADLTIIHANYTMENMYQHAAPLHGKKCYEVFQNSPKPCSFCPSVKAYENGKVCSEIIPLIEKNQQKGWLEVTSYPLVDRTTGNVEGIIESVRDISARIEMEQKLKNKTDELERFFSVNLDLLCIADLEGRFVRVNKAWERTLGYTVEFLEGKSFLDFVHEEDLSKTIEEMGNLENKERVLNFINRYRTKNGSYRFIEWRSQPHGNMIYAAARDITERIEIEQQLKDQKEQFELAIKGSNDGIWDWNLLTNELYLSPRWKEQLGFTDDEIPNELESFERRIHPDDAERVFCTVDNYLRGELLEYNIEFRMLHKDGHYRWMWARGEALRDSDGEAYRMAGSHSDITDNIEEKKKIQHLSVHDSLTGLYNRAYLNHMDINESNITVFSFDIDNLKYVNDTFGHIEGDKLIKSVAKTIKICFRENDKIIRMGGDEFIAIVEGSDKKRAEDIQKRITNEISKTKIKTNTLDYAISFSIGYAVSDWKNQTLEKLIIQADQMMYEEKRNKKARPL